MNVEEVGIERACLISDFVTQIARSHIGPTLGPGGLEELLSSFDVASTKARFNQGFVHWIAYNEAIDPIGVVVISPPSHLFHWFVRSDCQRQGIGRALLSVALDRIEHDTGVRSASVNASLNALDAYRRFGFDNRGQQVDHEGIRYQPMVFRQQSEPC